MSPFDVVRENVTARQVAEYYGLKVNRNGMACCPFHDDRTPSMKIDKRYYCFGCLAKGDAVDYVARMFGLRPKAAAEKICAHKDFLMSHIIKISMLYQEVKFRRSVNQSKELI